jgi:hypothetical protein
VRAPSFGAFFSCGLIVLVCASRRSRVHTCAAHRAGIPRSGGSLPLARAGAVEEGGRGGGERDTPAKIVRTGSALRALALLQFFLPPLSSPPLPLSSSFPFLSLFFNAFHRQRSRFPWRDALFV